jgi:hypothetical protein
MPSLTYWAVDGKPVSFREAEEARKRNEWRCSHPEITHTSREAYRLMKLIDKYKRQMVTARSQSKRASAKHHYKKYVAQVNAFLKWCVDNNKAVILTRDYACLPTCQPLHKITLEETEIARNLQDHLGWLEDVEEAEFASSEGIKP